MLFWLLFFAFSMAHADVSQVPSFQIVEDFSKGALGEFPKSFRTKPFQRGKAEKVYRIEQEGENLYLSADDSEEISTQIFKKFLWDLKKYPAFRWRWRARILPDGARESEPDRNDSACGIYVIFGAYTGDGLKYVWSSTLPVGTVYEKKGGKFYVIVKGNGLSKGGWREIHVNVLEDYRRLFKKEPKDNPIGLGILTDGNATHSPAACDYDDFIISKE
ncbi:MAG: DUF3047 domain-containing protein [Deltaproteobacteria bacterium]|nr:DUF3047 domain-containing protein [Deltaproteobacteria bacterium]